MIEPCFKPSTHPYHPFLFESDILMVIFTFTFVGTGTGGTSNRTIYLLRPQSLVLLMYPNPWSPHIAPHEFFTIQCVAVYPTNRIEWSMAASLGQSLMKPVLGAYINDCHEPFTPMLMGPYAANYALIWSSVIVETNWIFDAGVASLTYPDELVHMVFPGIVLK